MPLKCRLGQVPLQTDKKEKLKKFFACYEKEGNNIKDDMIGDLGCNLDIMPGELASYKLKKVTFS